jgi:hypothetical protein
VLPRGLAGTIFGVVGAPHCWRRGLRGVAAVSRVLQHCESWLQQQCVGAARVAGLV